MKIKTSELIGPALDWAVATCEGYTDLHKDCHRFGNESLLMTPPRSEYGAVLFADLAFATDWMQGGPIIEREQITLRTNACIPGHWAAFIDFGNSNTNIKSRQSGPTPLVAGMRCYVASEMGDEINIPDELIK